MIGECQVVDVIGILKMGSASRASRTTWCARDAMAGFVFVQCGFGGRVIAVDLPHDVDAVM